MTTAPAQAAPAQPVHVDGLRWRPLSRREPTIAGLDLEIPPGQRVLLAGASGSGKSTLLRALAGLLDPVDGDGEGLLPAPDRPGERGLLLQNPVHALVGAKKRNNNNNKKKNSVREREGCSFLRDSRNMGACASVPKGKKDEDTAAPLPEQPKEETTAAEVVEEKSEKVEAKVEEPAEKKPEGVDQKKEEENDQKVVEKESEAPKEESKKETSQSAVVEKEEAKVEVIPASDTVTSEPEKKEETTENEKQSEIVEEKK